MKKKYFVLLLFLAISCTTRFSIKENVKKSVVKVLHEEGGGGTGFVIRAASGRKLIVTNRHVCRSLQTPLHFESEYLSRAMPAHILEISKEHDLCLLEAPIELPALTLGYDPSIGDIVFIIGFPLLRGPTSSDGEIRSRENVTVLDTKDECSTAPMCFTDYDILEVSAPILPGNSGSPLISQSGTVIGVVFAGGAGTTAAVPYAYLKELLAPY